MAEALEAARWNAIVKRDASSTGAFVYCVPSTKIYCRPTCNARRPRRCTISTHYTAQEAEQGGFRPCKRCRPELESYTPQDDKIQAACDTICRYSLGPENPRLATLAKEAGLTKHHFHRLFKKKTGLTPIQFAEALRASDTDTSLSMSPSDDLYQYMPSLPTETPSPGASEQPTIDAVATVDGAELINFDLAAFDAGAAGLQYCLVDPELLTDAT